MNGRLRRLAVLLAVLALPAWLPALTIKMGTIAPANTPWDTALKTIASDWSSISGGQVSVRLYPGAVAGDENDMIRKMRIGQLQAAALSGEGLKQIVNDVIILDLPFLFTSGDEFRWVLDRVTPDFRKRFEEKGFVLLGWNIAGWINFFSRNPVVSPSDLMPQKLALSAGNDSAIIQGWQQAGFQVVPIGVSSLMSALSSGMVDAFYTEPLAAAAYQWFGIAKYMCNLKIAPLLGGIVVSERTWRQIPDRYKEQFIAATEKAEGPIFRNMSALEEEAMNVMVQNGLVVDKVPAAAAAEWRSTLTSGFDSLAGRAYSKDVYSEIVSLVQEYRSTHGQ